MLKLGITIKLCVLVALCSGCLTTSKYVGKSLHPNYYVYHCQTFPAYGYQTEKFFDYNYEIQKREDNKYILKGGAKFKPGEPGWKGLAAVDRLEIEFALIKDNVIVDSIRILTTGNPAMDITFNKSFSTEHEFNGITIISRVLHGWS